MPEIVAMVSSQDFRNLLTAVGLSCSPGTRRSEELPPPIYQELQNLAVFKNGVGTCYYFATQFTSAELFALLDSISRING